MFLRNQRSLEAIGQAVVSSYDEKKEKAASAIIKSMPLTVLGDTLWNMIQSKNPDCTSIFENDVPGVVDFTEGTMRFTTPLLPEPLNKLSTLNELKQLLYLKYCTSGNIKIGPLFALAMAYQTLTGDSQYIDLTRKILNFPSPYTVSRADFEQKKEEVIRLSAQINPTYAYLSRWILEREQTEQMLLEQVMEKAVEHMSSGNQQEFMSCQKVANRLMTKYQEKNKNSTLSFQIEKNQLRILEALLKLKNQEKEVKEIKLSEASVSFVNDWIRTNYSAEKKEEKERKEPSAEKKEAQENRNTTHPAEATAATARLG